MYIQNNIHLVMVLATRNRPENSGLCIIFSVKSFSRNFREIDFTKN